MRIHHLMPAILCAWLPLSSAQVSVEVVLTQEKFLPGEELMAGVRVVNRSGQALHLGQAADWIRFNISERRAAS